MNSDRTLKKIFSTKPDGGRIVGRPKLRWEDGVDKDVIILGVKNWKKVALNRDEWAQLLKKARAPSEAVEPMMMMYCLRHVSTFGVNSHWEIKNHPKKDNLNIR
jgi:hypothetical protein